MQQQDRQLLQKDTLGLDYLILRSNGTACRQFTVPQHWTRPCGHVAQLSFMLSRRITISGGFPSTVRLVGNSLYHNTASTHAQAKKGGNTDLHKHIARRACKSNAGCPYQHIHVVCKHFAHTHQNSPLATFHSPAAFFRFRMTTGPSASPSCKHDDQLATHVWLCWNR